MGAYEDVSCRERGSKKVVWVVEQKGGRWWFSSSGEEKEHGSHFITFFPPLTIKIAYNVNLIT